jgi:hypothetical protein
MAYYLTDPYFYLPKSFPHNTSTSPSTYFQGLPSNRMSSRAKLIE